MITYFDMFVYSFIFIFIWSFCFFLLWLYNKWRKGRLEKNYNVEQDKSNRDTIDRRGVEPGDAFLKGQTQQVGIREHQLEGGQNDPEPDSNPSRPTGEDNYDWPEFK